MRDLPSGTVTLVFTDIEGSTSLMTSLGDEYADVLAEHRRILRDAFTKRGGIEVDTQGDAFFYAFTRAGDAVEAASEGQDGLAEGPVRVRIGVHTGEPLVAAEGYVGIDVHRAARIAAAAHGGQVVISQTTRDLVDSDPGLRDLGVHRLKDLTAPERLYQLGDTEFPPLRTLDATNLPVTASPLLGREQELEQLVTLLTEGPRLVTVTGPGGTGKTRLALQVAAELVGTFLDGVFWVPLAGLTDPELVLPEIARMLPARDDLLGYLRGKQQLLLLLDNFEHLLAAAPDLASLLTAADGLRVIVTSRAPLRIFGEREYPLEPLPPHDAVTLFLERARGVGKDLVPDPTIESICRRLDGLPLAIELAAARTKLLSPEALLERLDRALSLLTGGARDAPERQRTLRATIEWSHDLLDEESKRLFARLSVFLGSFPLEAAEEVCYADLDAVAALVDLSLLKPIAEDRFLMLETIREYAAEKLEGSGEADELRSRHANAFRSLAAECYGRRVDAEAECSERLESDHDDLRAALEWLAAHDPDAELELAGALGWFWLSRSHLHEGRRRLTDALARSRAEGSVRAVALTAVGGIAGWQADADGLAWLSEGITLWRELGDVAELAYALETLGWILFVVGDNLPSLAAFEESLELRRASGDARGEMRSLGGVCQMLVAESEVDRAEPLSRQLLELAGDLGDLRSEHFAYHFLGDCALIGGDYDEAEDRYRASLRAALPLGNLLETSFEVQGVGMSAAGKGDWARGVRLAAAGYALWESIGFTPSVPFWNALLDRHIGAARDRLGSEGDAVFAEGHAMSFEDAVSLALASG